MNKSSNIRVLSVLDFYFNMIIVCTILMVLLNIDVLRISEQKCRL